MRVLTLPLAVLLVTACGPAPSARTEAGRQLIANHCGACHRVPGVASATGRVGPSLDGMARQQLIAGYFANSPEMMHRWVAHAQTMLPGNGMPDLDLTAAEADLITEYLYTLD